MTLDEFRDVVLDTSQKDDDIKKIYLQLVIQTIKWRLSNRANKEITNPFEYINNGEALTFIKTHRPEVHAELKNKGY